MKRGRRLKTLSEILGHCRDYLLRCGVDSPRREAEDLLSDVLHCSRVTLYMQHDRPMVEAELSECRKRLVRRGRGEPLAYIHGSVVFHSCTLCVTQDVLIPRQETEILVEEIIQAEKAAGRTPQAICDLATGSGCIGIALKRSFPHAAVTLTDLSPAALKIAQENAVRNQAEVTCCQGDLLAPLAGRQFDLLVCNPPYISESEYTSLAKEVRHFEPKQALVAGKSGLEYYARLAQGLSSVMLPGGRVWFEIGHTQGSAVLAYFSDPIWTKQQIRCDWSQKERFFSLEKELGFL